MRSPGNNADKARFVYSDDGRVIPTGLLVDVAHLFSLRPALFFNLKSSQATSLSADAAAALSAAQLSQTGLPVNLALLLFALLAFASVVCRRSDKL